MELLIVAHSLTLLLWHSMVIISGTTNDRALNHVAAAAASYLLIMLDLRIPYINLSIQYSSVCHSLPPFSRPVSSFHGQPVHAAMPPVSYPALPCLASPRLASLPFDEGESVQTTKTQVSAQKPVPVKPNAPLTARVPRTLFLQVLILHVADHHRNHAGMKMFCFYRCTGAP